MPTREQTRTLFVRRIDDVLNREYPGMPRSMRERLYETAAFTVLRMERDGKLESSGAVFDATDAIEAFTLKAIELAPMYEIRGITDWIDRVRDAICPLPPIC